MSTLYALFLLAGGYSFYYLGKEGLKYMEKAITVEQFPIGEEHCSILGKTQYGKTYGTIKTLAKMKKGVLFFNTNHTPVKERGFTKGDGKASMEQVIELLKAGRKINFLPSDLPEHAEVQLQAIVNELYLNHEELDIYIAVDEVHLFKKEGLKACKRIATTGQSKGLKGIWISQRGANVNNDLLSQASKHIFFYISPHDQKYLRELSIPVDEMMDKIQNQKYIFSVYDEETVKGGFTIGKKTGGSTNE